MLSISLPVVRRWQRKLTWGIFFKKARAVSLFVRLALLAVVGFVPAVWALFFQEPVEVNIWFCAVGMIVAIGAVAAIGFLALRRLGKH